MKIGMKAPVTAWGMIFVIVLALVAWSEAAPWYGKGRRFVVSKVKGSK